MMTLLGRFSALTLLSGAMMFLLPEGTLKKTAAMVVGLMMLMLWSEGLQSAFSAFTAEASPPPTVLEETGLALRDAEAAAQYAIVGGGHEP